MKVRHKIIAKGRTHFQRFVDCQANSAEESLPLTHTTDAFDLRDIIDSQEIKPRFCPVFGEDLSYQFYGRPAYRKNGSVQANSLAAYAPIILIFRPSVSTTAIAAFPFDSGAFKSDRYSELAHHRMSVEDFGLDPSYDRIGKMVAFFFGDNKRYYDQLASTDCTIGSDEFEAQTVRELTTYRGRNDRDDRSSTIELIFSDAISLHGNLLGIIVPGSFLEDKVVSAKLHSLDVHIRSYIDGANLTPASQIPRLADVVRHFYIEQGILRT
ncbi:hypothetical protein [Bradyrhizobium sp. LB11.1]|uniref:hypothetical protein n=1 Tax=Bradyrhizobium sp. LB11.1 TaxID=3156326 RepID=UPI00339119C6